VDWETQRLCWRDSEDWSDWRTEEMKCDGTPGGALVVTPNAQEVSISFDGSTEYLADFVGRNMVPGGSLDYTCAVWAKMVTPFPLPQAVMFSWFNNPLTSVLGGTLLSVVNGAVFFLRMGAGDGGLPSPYKKWYTYTKDVALHDEWAFYVITFSGTEPSDNPFGPETGRLRLYIDGVLQTAIGYLIDAEITESEFAQAPMYCPAFDILGSAKMAANIYDFAMWPGEATPDEVSKLYNGGVPVDYSQNFIGYSKADDLYHWIRFGEDLGDLAKDSGTAEAGNLRVFFTVGINTDDVIPDWPGA
jgi:hypothetical protein